MNNILILFKRIKLQVEILHIILKTITIIKLEISYY